MHTSQARAPKAVQDWHDCLAWMVPLLDQFPRARRFTLGERIESGPSGAGRAIECPGRVFIGALLGLVLAAPGGLVGGVYAQSLEVQSKPAASENDDSLVPGANVGFSNLQAQKSSRLGARCGSTPGEGPEMVTIAAGRFWMGSPENEAESGNDEARHGVAVVKPFALSRCEVTLAEFRVFVEDTGYDTDAERSDGCFGPDGSNKEITWRSPGFAQGENHPVTCITWNDARAYAAWMSLRTRRDYRLPTEAEWEYAARAGTTTVFWSGECINTDQANYNGKFDYNDCGAKTEVYRQQTVEAGSLAGNPWGLYEVTGNLWEWSEDCYTRHDDTPTDGRAWESDGECALRVLRGGGWDDVPLYLRSAGRFWLNADVADDNVGFRLARTL